MSELRKKNPNKDNYKGQAIIVRKVSHPYEHSHNKFMAIALVAFMALIVLLGFVLIPETGSQFQDVMDRQKIGRVFNEPMNPVVSAEINMLKAQLVGLISGSIESKLSTLENSVRTGIISSTDMQTIQDLKNDLKVLKTYSTTGAGGLIAQPELDMYSSRQSLKAQQKIPTDQVLSEINQLKGLVYISIASCGLMLAAVGSVWLQSRRTLGYQKDKQPGMLSRDK